jgi:Alpha-L-arabinofuranosidase B, catalytic
MQRPITRQRKFFFENAARSVPAPLLLDTLWGESCRFAHWTGGKLRAGYVGPIVRARRLSDNATIEVYPLPNGTTDTAAIVAYGTAAASVVTMATLYDQSGRGAHIGASGVSREAELWSPTNGLCVGTKGYLASRWVGTSKWYSNSNGAGITTGFLGNPEMHLVWDQKPTTANCCPWVFGNNGVAYQHMQCRPDTSATQMISIATGAAVRTFTAASNLASNSFILSKPAGAQVDGITLRRSGVQLVQSAVVGNDALLDLLTDDFAYGTFTSSGGNFDGLLANWMGFSSVLSAVNRAKIEAWQANTRC